MPTDAVGRTSSKIESIVQDGPASGAADPSPSPWASSISAGPEESTKLSPALASGLADAISPPHAHAIVVNPTNAVPHGVRCRRCCLVSKQLLGPMAGRRKIRLLFQMPLEIDGSIRWERSTSSTLRWPCRGILRSLRSAADIGGCARRREGVRAARMAHHDDQLRDWRSRRSSARQRPPA